MSTNKTPNLNLHAWEPTDPFTRAEFNDNFNTIDTTWADLTGGIAQKLGQLELIYHHDTSGENYGNAITFSSSIVDSWDDWSYVCALVHYTDMDTGTARPKFTIVDRGSVEKVISPLALPGYMVVLLPMRDASRNVGGFVFSDRFYSFSADFSYQRIRSFSVGVGGGSPICPSVYFFGSR